MNVFFGCTTQKILKYKNSYEVIRKSILDLGHTLTRDWIPEAIEEASLNLKKSRRSEIYDDVMNAILNSDVAIFEVSVPGMSVGHQITFSIEKSKPTLLLSRSLSKKTEDLFIAGTKSPYLIFKDYRSNTQLPEIIKGFLSSNSPTSKTRFNLVIERELNNYIEWAAFKYHLSKTEVIKSAISTKIGADINYQKSLKDKK